MSNKKSCHSGRVSLKILPFETGTHGIWQHLVFIDKKLSLIVNNKVKIKDRLIRIQSNYVKSHWPTCETTAIMHNITSKSQCLHAHKFHWPPVPFHRAKCLSARDPYIQLLNIIKDWIGCTQWPDPLTQLGAKRGGQCQIYLTVLDS